MPLTEDKTFMVTNPADYDGDPYDVAVRAILQTEALVEILDKALDSARIMARNAELERQLALTGECDAPGFDDSPQGRHFAKAATELDNVGTRLRALRQAAGYNPKAKIGSR